MRASLCMLISSLLLLNACQSSLSPEPTTLTDFDKIDSRLWPYFNEFELLANSFGLNIDLSLYDLTAEIKQINENHIAGICQYTNRSNNRYIQIDQDFWNNSNSLYREYIIFHELGHCILGRDHLEGCRVDGSYLSLMRSGNGNCRDRYTSTTRNYYLNELFGALVN
jgi:hypothetical protein